MNFFNVSEPLIRSKQAALDVQDLQGLLQVRWRFGNMKLLSLLYTRIDQVFVVWGWITGLIFTTAQFLPLSWHLQAVLWSVLTLVGVLMMLALAWFWVRVEQLCWVVYVWAALMLIGLGLTDGSIFFSWGHLLIHLCSLWLGLSAIGYFCTGWGLRSRTFMLASFLHLLCLVLLPYSAPWSFVTTGAVMAGTLLFLATVQWDMRPPSATARLTAEQQQFNREQYQRRLADQCCTREPVCGQSCR